jgi:hypothetical protein
MKEIKSWSSIIFPVAANWSVMDLASSKYVEQFLDPCVIVCSYLLICAM